MKFSANLLLFIINLLWIYTCHSQNFHFRTFSTADGLNTYNTRQITQDDFKFIWIATQDGVDRFDGKDFVNINKTTTANTSLGGSFVTDCKKDNTGAMWISTEYGGIDVINPQNLQVIKRLRNNENSGLISDWVRSIAFANSNDVWVGTYYGISIYNRLKNIYKHIIRNPFDSTVAFNVNFLTRDQQGNIWVSVENTGVAIFNNEGELKQLLSKKKLGDIAGNSFRLTDVYTASDGIVYLCTNAGLKCLVNTEGKYAEKKLRPELQGLGLIETHCILNDSFNMVWIGTSNGLYIYNTRLHRLDHCIHQEAIKNTILDNYINNIFQDSFSNIWISTSKGVNLLTNIEYTIESISYDSKTKKSLDHIYSITPVNDSSVLAGTSTNLVLINTKKNSFQEILSTSKFGLIDAVASVAADLLIVSSEKRNILIRKKKSSYEAIPLNSRFPELREIENVYFSTIKKLNDSILLFGSRDESGLFVWNKKAHALRNFKSVKGTDAFLLDNYIQNIKQDKKGNIWIISDLTLTRFDLDNSHFFHIQPKPQTPNRINSYFLMDLYDDGEQYWITTYGGGVNIISKDYRRIYALTTKDGLSANTTYSIAQENDSLIWVSSNNGLSRINTRNKSIRQFHVEDGLQSNSFEIRSSCRLKDEILFGGIDGITRIKRNSTYNKISSFPVYFSKIAYQADENKTLIDSLIHPEKIKIPNRYTSLAISISGSGFSQQREYIYEYKIDGLNEDWVSLKNDNTINLTGLAHGSYKIQARISNEKSQWNYSEIITIEVQPKWYQTWWFKTLISLSVVCIGWAFYKMRIRQLHKEEEIRSRLASDLHDDLGSTLNSVKVYANLALIEKGNPNYLNLVKESTQEAISGLRDLIWVLDDKKDTLDHLLNRVNQFARPLCAANGTQFNTTIDQGLHSYVLGKEERRNLYLVIKETINNSIKYAACGQIELLIKLTGKKLSVRIIDNGIGFDSKQVIYGNGIKNINDRAKAAGYTVVVVSAPGNGCFVLLEKMG